MRSEIENQFPECFEYPAHYFSYRYCEYRACSTKSSEACLRISSWFDIQLDFFLQIRLCALLYPAVSKPSTSIQFVNRISSWLESKLRSKWNFDLRPSMSELTLQTFFSKLGCSLSPLVNMNLEFQCYQFLLVYWLLRMFVAVCWQCLDSLAGVFTASIPV